MRSASRTGVILLSQKGCLARYFSIMTRSSSSISRKNLRTSSGVGASRCGFIYHLWDGSVARPFGDPDVPPSFFEAAPAPETALLGPASPAPSNGGRNACTLTFWKAVDVPTFWDDSGPRLHDPSANISLRLSICLPSDRVCSGAPFVCES